MTLPFADRQPTSEEVERIRLCLSTFQDGSGMEGKGNLPGWRDFERSVAAALVGQAVESKAIFDVVLTRPEGPAVPQYGLSCKMRGELNRVDRDGRVTIEVSNSSGKFWDHLATKQSPRNERITQQNYIEHPALVGESIVELVTQWHEAVSCLREGTIDLSKSSYLVLSWNAALWYQLHQFRLDIIKSSSLEWFVPSSKRGEDKKARRVCGSDGTGNRVEWYGLSGGQLKYYPLATEAVWQSNRFRLEPLPEQTYGLGHKVEAYFPELWKSAFQKTSA